MNAALRVRGLKKSYGKQEVLKGLDLEVKKGEIFALLGRNGAGKTTALECIEGLKRNDGGSIEINGKKGIQMQSASLPAYIRPEEALSLFAKWNHTERNLALFDGLGIGGIRRKQYRELSEGQKRRLHLALALVNDPDILFLDEPSAGLDAEGREDLHRKIRGLREEGRTVILASHDMAEVENLCDRLAILSDGKVSFTGTAEELTARTGRRYSVRIQTNRGEYTAETGQIAEKLMELLKKLKEEGIQVEDVHINRGTLEQNFISFLKGGKG